MITTITRKWLRRRWPCWSDYEIAKIVPKEGISVLADVPEGVPLDDVIWVLLRVLPRKERTLLVCDWAQQACLVNSHNDERSIRAITLSRAYVKGECSRKELEEAWLETTAARAYTAAAVNTALNSSYAAQRAGVPAVQQVDDLRRVIRELVEVQS